MKRQKDRFLVFAELWETLFKYASIALLCIVLLYGFDSLLSTNYDHAPCIMYESRLYFCPHQAKLHLPEEAVFCGRVENSVEPDKWPTENLQSNRPIWEGKDVYRISADQIAIQTDEGWLYFEVKTEEQEEGNKTERRFFFPDQLTRSGAHTRRQKNRPLVSNSTSYSSDALGIEIHYPSEWAPKIKWVDTTTWGGFINGQIDPVECVVIFPYWHWHTAENFDDMICIIYFRPFEEHGPEGDSGSHVILKSCEDGEYIAWCPLTCKMNYDFESEEWETFQLIENGILQNQITLRSVQ